MINAAHETTRRRRRLRYASSVALSVAVAGGSLVLGTGVSSASSKSPAKAVSKKSLAKFETCLTKQGVKISLKGLGSRPTGAPTGTIPTGTGAPKGIKTSAKVQKAFKACSSLLPAGSGFGAPPTSSQSVATADATFRNCMTLHHVTLAKGAYGTTTSSNSVTSTSSSTYEKAYSACSALLPTTTTTAH